jgi:dTDP-glucose pyrophosphorylase
MWGIIPAAGRGSRIQPRAFSTELLPVGSRSDGGTDRPVAVSEYVVERLLGAGISKLCFVIAPGKSDIIEYYGGSIAGAEICYVVQDRPAGLCDALFRALPFLDEEDRVYFGLPDTIWFPEEGLLAVTEHPLDFLLFPVEHPEFFDAVRFETDGNVIGIDVKAEAPQSHWIWGAFGADARMLRELHALWCERERRDEYIGLLVNAHLARGGRAHAVPAGQSYVDVGTLHGYREATRLLEARREAPRGSGLGIADRVAHPVPRAAAALKQVRT